MDPQQLYQSACEHLHAGRQAEAEATLLSLLEQPYVPMIGKFLPSLESFLSDALSQSLTPSDWSLSCFEQGRFLLAQLYWQQARYAEAIACLEILLLANPVAELYHQLARWYLELNQYEDCNRVLQDAIRVNPAYLPAYEDAAMLANLRGDSQGAFALIQAALQYELTPRLLQELILASSRDDFVPMRSLFVELCVYVIRPENKALLIPLLQHLYELQDWHHAAYLGSHLWHAFPQESEVLNIYVLSLIKQAQYVPALQTLLAAPEKFWRDGSQWFKLGVAYSLWKMPLFSNFAFDKARTLTRELEPDIVKWQSDLVLENNLDSVLTQVLRQMLVYPLFRDQIRLNPEQALKNWGIEISPELADAIHGLPGIDTIDLHQESR